MKSVNRLPNHCKEAAEFAVVSCVYTKRFCERKVLIYSPSLPRTHEDVPSLPRAPAFHPSPSQNRLPITILSGARSWIVKYRLPRRLYPSATLPEKSLLMKTPTTMGTPSGAKNASGDGVPELSPLGITREVEGGVENGGVLGSGGDFGERGPGVDLSLLRGALVMTSRALYHEEVLNGCGNARDLAQR